MRQKSREGVIFVLPVLVPGLLSPTRTARIKRFSACVLDVDKLQHLDGVACKLQLARTVSRRQPLFENSVHEQRPHGFIVYLAEQLMLAAGYG